MCGVATSIITTTELKAKKKVGLGLRLRRTDIFIANGDVKEASNLRSCGVGRAPGFAYSCGVSSSGMLYRNKNKRFGIKFSKKHVKLRQVITICLVGED